MTKIAECRYARRIKQDGLYRRPYRSPRVFREFTLALDILLGHVRSGRVLDLGCGPGWTTLHLARAGYEAVGVDIADRMIEIARDRAEREGVEAEFLVADIETLNLRRRDFDAVLLFDALHHCPAYGEVLRRAGDHLRPGGYLLLLEPSWLHRFSPHARREVKRFGVTELGFTRRQLRQALRQAGFERVWSFYDPGPIVRGPVGVLFACLRVCLGFAVAFPQTKQIMLARKGPADRTPATC